MLLMVTFFPPSTCSAFICWATFSSSILNLLLLDSYLLKGPNLCWIYNTRHVSPLTGMYISRIWWCLRFIANADATLAARGGNFLIDTNSSESELNEWAHRPSHGDDARIRYPPAIFFNILEKKKSTLPSFAAFRSSDLLQAISIQLDHYIGYIK